MKTDSLHGQIKQPTKLSRHSNRLFRWPARLPRCEDRFFRTQEGLFRRKNSLHKETYTLDNQPDFLNSLTEVYTTRKTSKYADNPDTSTNSRNNQTNSVETSTHSINSQTKRLDTENWQPRQLVKLSVCSNKLSLKSKQMNRQFRWLKRSPTNSERQKK